jgi:hypothetical protein
MPAPAPRRPSLAFLVGAWILFLLFGAGYVLSALALGRWPSPHILLFCVLIWLVISGLLVRRLYPESRLARVLPRTIQGQPADAQVARPLLTIACVLALALLVVSASLFFHWF